MTRKTKRSHTSYEERLARKEEERLLLARLRAARRRSLFIWIGVGLACVAAAAAIYFFVILPDRNAQASVNTGSGANQANPAVDGIACDQLEGTKLHFHVHISIYVNGSPVSIPQSIGIVPNTCYYWTHTHDNSGIVHIEAPAQQSFTLGNFFHVWEQQFTQLQYPVQLDTTDNWQVFVNGKPYHGNFHNMTLTSHLLITLAYNSPGIKPDTIYNWGDLSQ
jgi:hypothetical protein